MNQNHNRLINSFIDDLDRILMRDNNNRISPGEALHDRFPHIFQIMLSEFLEDIDNSNYQGQKDEDFNNDNN